MRLRGREEERKRGREEERKRGREWLLAAAVIAVAAIVMTACPAPTRIAAPPGETPPTETPTPTPPGETPTPTPPLNVQTWLDSHNARHPRTDLPLPAGVDPASNPSHLGGQRNHGEWPFWSTGNQDIVIEGPVPGRNTYQMAVPGSLTGGGTGYGQHGVSFRLSGPNSLNAQVGDTIRIAGYMRGTITAEHALGPGVGLRHYGANSPWDNFHSVRWGPGLTDHPFEITWVLRPREFESIPPWASGNPTLTVVREPSQSGVIMVIQHFEVIR